MWLFCSHAPHNARVSRSFCIRRFGWLWPTHPLWNQVLLPRHRLHDSIAEGASTKYLCTKIGIFTPSLLQCTRFGRPICAHTLWSTPAQVPTRCFRHTSFRFISASKNCITAILYSADSNFKLMINNFIARRKTGNLLFS
jgi:hypothetical protein